MSKVYPYSTKFQNMKIEDKTLQTLREVAQALGATHIQTALEQIIVRQSQQECPITLPLVGEFSAGKTSLLNALTDTKALETAVLPTTATLFEVHFGCPTAYAEVLSANGETQRVNDIASLKNSQLGSAQLVTVFDTSTRVSPEIVLVDTPGLSAPDPRHRQVLTEFLPKADAILLVSDINQQLTRSLANFCRDMKLANKSIYMVLTKCDSKTPDERKAARDYILAQRELGFADVVCVSGVTGEVDELMKVFKEISAKKQEILAKADTARLAQIKQELETTLEEQIAALESIDNCKAALAEEERKLKQLQNAINRLTESCDSAVDDIARDTRRVFATAMQQQLCSLVQQSGNNFDRQAIDTINKCATITMQQFRSRVQQAIVEASNRASRESGLSTEVLQSVDLSQVECQGLSYGINLNQIGHEYDSYIKFGALAAVGAAAMFALPAAGIVGSVGGAALEVGEVAAINRARTMAARASRMVQKAQEYVERGRAIDQQVGDNLGQNDGMVSKLIGWTTDKIYGKSQREYTVRTYLDQTLIPEFESVMNGNRALVFELIKEALQRSNEAAIAERRRALEQVRDEHEQKKAETETRRSQLQGFRTALAQL